MERRNRSLEALNKLQYINSLDEDIKADSLVMWAKEYLNDNFIENLELEHSLLVEFSELFYSNIKFLKQQKELLRAELLQSQKIKKFLT